MPDPKRYAFGDFVLDPAQQRLVHRDGAPIALTPRLFGALCLFVEHPGELLDKELLMRELWPGLVVEENNLSQVVSGLRRALGEDAQGSRFIQTVPRRGFRFVAPVTLVSSSLPPPATAPADTPAALAHAPRRNYIRLGLALGGCAALGVGGWWGWRRASTAAPGHEATLAVLPFRPLVGQEPDELLGLGMADSLIARLSTVQGLVVSSIGAVRRFAGGSGQTDPLNAARELGVAWVVDGSLQHRGDQLRVTARLLRVADGSAAWSDSFDEKYNNVFEVQDRISQRVTQALAPVLRRDSVSAGPPLEPGGTRSTEAYQLYLAARWRAQGTRAADIDRGLALLHRALTLDPRYAVAWVELAQVHRRRLWGTDGVPSEIFAPINTALQRALDIVPGMAAAQVGRGFSRYWFDFNWAAAEQDFRCGLEIQPGMATGTGGWRASC